jgi:PAS domain S-box-containing protein
MANDINILHIDDEPSFADLTARFLEREDDRFTVEKATSPDRGLELISDCPPDCIVSDYNMPGMDGIELLEAVRDKHPELPFILYTGRGSEEVASKAISAGVTDYIQKQRGTDHYLLLANRIENAVTNYRSQRLAKQRKERLELFFEESPLGSIQWDDSFRFERVNGKAEELLGYSETELRGESWERIVADDDRGRVGSAVERLLDVDGGTHVVNDNVRKDGKIRTCEWHNRVVTDSNGNVQSVFSKFQDVTDRERRKTELEEYETIIEALSDAVYVLDEEGQFTYVNDEFVELVGYGRETVLGNTPSLIKGEAAVEQAEQELGRLLSGDGPEAVTFEVTIHPREGDPIVCEDHMGVLPYDGDKFGGSVGTLRNITDHKKREEKLQDISDQYRTLVENLPDGAVFLYDSDSRVVRAGGAELSEVGLSAEEIVGTTPRDRYPPEIAEELVGNIENALNGESHTFEQELGGEHYRVQTVPVRTGGGEITYSMAVSRNITENVERRQELEGKTLRLEEFASVLSHDLRNPLDMASGWLELAQEECDSDHLEEIEHTHDRMRELIEDLLTLAREGAEVGEIEPVDLTEIVEGCWGNVDTREATLETDTSGVIRADPSRVKQLLENLIRNAVEHGGAGVSVHVGSMDGGFYVADTGSGVPEAERGDIFEAGYSTNEDGTGLGLWIVEQIAEAHGWEVTLTGSEQGGARFEVTEVESVG